MQKEWLTVAQAAKILRLSRPRVYQLVEESDYYGLEIWRPHGNAVLISKASIEKFRKLDRPPGRPTTDF